MNLVGSVVLMQQSREELARNRGAIVNFSSVGGLNAEDRARVAYSAAKAGVHSVTKSFAVEYGGEGIRTNCIAPGFTLTELTRQTPPEMMSYMCAKSPMGRGGEAEERRTLGQRFMAVADNWWRIMQRTKMLNSLIAGYEQVATIFAVSNGLMDDVRIYTSTLTPAASRRISSERGPCTATRAV